jgi:xylan 1,4-beta-xylosidase
MTAEPVAVTIERIDEHHANPRQAWQAMGEPEYLTRGQLDRLQTASRLRKRSLRYRHQDGDLMLTFRMPPQGVAVITVRMAPGGEGGRHRASDG